MIQFQCFLRSYAGESRLRLLHPAPQCSGRSYAHDSIESIHCAYCNVSVGLGHVRSPTYDVISQLVCSYDVPGFNDVAKNVSKSFVVTLFYQ